MLALPPNPNSILGSRGGEGSTETNGLADTAVICSCENVTKGAICCSITDATCETLGDVVN
jgi:nitrite reductase (NADH) large subunit